VHRDYSRVRKPKILNQELSTVPDGFTWFKQAAYRWVGDGMTVYIDPLGLTDDAAVADVIFLTHAHDDHLSPADLERIQGEGKTKIFAPADVASKLSGDVTAVAPGDSFDAAGIRAQAVPAYNVLEERLDFHPKSKKWVGYVLELGGRTVYHAGDTDHAEELNSIKADIAFLPIGGTYTMTAPEAAGLAKAMRPGLAIPMHYGFAFEGEMIGHRRDGEVFREECEPDVKVELLEPVQPWGK
jgi:L-ascorbate metabolism protein UlaG (beta-lactamase superfamily)